ncbi:glycerol-3-phosphate acyltransferase 1, mitochondrial isoform X2 [Lingula anatina]|uniref:Glycerol-3-phosphate acyltransferase 1, mitochondrial isoform X2 n=1 Tax=Lingula anatina TaxID=7574 RepID=A0A1S3I442_LINAN|nr:glycerol-3-phosphate acyltransferase 1, mitochondrial isoform X2 [Lingula anatina]|eukprot:XP_013393003.1 glycerol-3-phosphate acyltransferase 1, mitochondrial isoform X2 [Lingula anatina]
MTEEVKSNWLYQESTSKPDIADVFREYDEYRRRKGYLARVCMSFSCTLQSRTQSSITYPDVAKQVMKSKRIQATLDTCARQDCPKEATTFSLDNEEEFEDPKQLPEKLAFHMKRANHLLSKMKAGISLSLLKLTSWVLHRVLRYFLSTVQVHKGQMEMVQKAAESSHPLIFLPHHRSHLDYVVVTFILYNYGIKVPHVAAGDNLMIPVFGSFMRGLGGYFIRRKLDKVEGKKDLLYRAVLHTYMQELLRAGQNMEFFIEGGRTRSGKAAAPKGGLLSVVIDSYMDGLLEDAYIIPVSINYEKILDGTFFIREQMGEQKIKETFWGALKAVWRVLMSHYGNIRVDFAQPFSLKEYLQSAQYTNMEARKENLESRRNSFSRARRSSGKLRPSGSLTSLYGTDVVVEDQRQTVKDLAQHVVYTFVNSSTIMCTTMLAFLLVTKHRKGARLEELVQSFEWLKEEITFRGRDVGFVGRAPTVIQYAADVLGDNVVKKYSVPADDSLAGSEDSIGTELMYFEPVTCLPDVFELRYYASGAISVFLMESIIATTVYGVASDDLDIRHISTTDVFVSHDEVMEKAQRLCALLQYEFLFVPPCTSLGTELSSAMDKLITYEILREEESSLHSAYTDSREMQWAKRFASSLKMQEYSSDEEEEEEVAFKKLQVLLDEPDCYNRFNFLLTVLAPYIESYWIVVQSLTRLLKEDMPENEFLGTIHQIALDRVEDGVAEFAESVSMECLKNAIKALQSIKVLEIYYDTKTVEFTKTVSLCDKYREEERLNDFIDFIEDCRM